MTAAGGEGLVPLAKGLIWLVVLGPLKILVDRYFYRNLKGNLNVSQGAT